MLKNSTDLQQIIYCFLVTQIEFGTYGYRASLPTIEELGCWFSVSQDTVRPAYLRLKQEGYITLTKKAGARVAVQYSPREMEQHAQSFFAPRQNAVIDLCRSMNPLFSHVQWYALKNLSTEQLNELEDLCLQQNVDAVLLMVRHLHLIYSTLNNPLLLRLVWYAFMFFQAPFISLPQNRISFKYGNEFLLQMIHLCREKNWKELESTVEVFQLQLISAIYSFYEKQIPADTLPPQISFQWNVYQNSSQRCYSLAMKFLIMIARGKYTDGDFLPSPAALAKAEHVSVNTIRRTLLLLNKLGAVQSVNGIGTKVLNTENSAQNCDFSDSVIQKRLIDFVQSLQIFTLICKASAEITFSSMNPDSLRLCCEEILELKRAGRPETIVYVFMSFISRYAPYHTIREICSQLLQMLFWGYPLRSIHGTREIVNTFYFPYVDAFADFLAHGNSVRAASMLEELLLHELTFADSRLKELNITGFTGMPIPE